MVSRSWIVLANGLGVYKWFNRTAGGLPAAGPVVTATHLARVAARHIVKGIFMTKISRRVQTPVRLKALGR
jgi:hypothetical protein